VFTAQYGLNIYIYIYNRSILLYGGQYQHSPSSLVLFKYDFSANGSVSASRYEVSYHQTKKSQFSLHYLCIPYDPRSLCMIISQNGFNQLVFVMEGLRSLRGTN
jgi:hypothetical protein